jgi:hypothetical protein
MTLYARTKNSYGCPFYVGEDLKSIFDDYIDSVTQVQADGDELEKSCKILGRHLPDTRVYTFYGDNAREILLNWS